MILYISFMMMALNAMQSLNAFNTVAFQDVISVFNFLPDQQFSHLRSQIYDILQNRQAAINPKSVYLEAASIVSEIQNAYANVVSLPHNQLLKRGEQNKTSQLHSDHATGDTTEPMADEKNGRKAFESSSLDEISKYARYYGFLNIFDLSVPELQILLDVMEGNKNHGMYFYLNLKIRKECTDSTRYCQGSVKKYFPVKLILDIEGSKIKTSSRLLKDLDDLSKFQGKEKDTKLLSIIRKISLIIHPDHNAAAHEIFVKQRPKLESMASDILELSGDKMLFSGATYDEIIEAVKSYEKGQKWWVSSSDSKIWKAFRDKAKKFFNGPLAEDIKAVKQLLELKKKGEDASYDFQMTYLKRKYDEFVDLALNEIMQLEEYIYTKTSKNSKIYRNRKWVELQRLLEDRFDNLMSIAEHVNKRYDSEKSNGEYDTQLRPVAATKYINQKSAPPKIIGGILFLAVLAWLKQMAHDHRMRRFSNDGNSRFQEDGYDDFQVPRSNNEITRKPGKRRRKKKHVEKSFDDDLENL